MTLKEALQTLYPDSSRRTLQNWIARGRFSVDGERIQRENTPLHIGQTLTSKETFKAPKVKGVKILYEDRHLIAIEKPAGLLSVALDEGTYQRHALGLLKEAITPSIFAVHRIDRDVSGVLLFARGKASVEKLKALFEKHDLTREYFAILEGRISENVGTWNAKLTELPTYDVVPSPDGRDAITHFKVIRRSAKFSYVQVVLETGRKHQIRVHSQIAGHPIVGDLRYGAKENPIGRICLHATKLEFTHPFTGKRLTFRSSLPRSFKVIGA